MSSDADAPKYHVTFFEDKFATKLKSADLTLEELAGRIRTTEAPTKDKLPWLKMARFGKKIAGTGNPPSKCLRHDDNVIEITGVELDYDERKITFEQALETIRGMRLRAILYTSPSHEDDKPKWRILAPTSTPLPPSERERLVARINGAMGKPITKVESFTLSQSYYYGQAVDNEGANHRAIITVGKYIDQLTDLAKFEADGYVSVTASANGKAPHNPFEEAGEEEKRGRTLEEIIALLESCGPGEWHIPMRSAIASMVGRQWPRDAIIAMCVKHANRGINDRDIRRLVDTAIDKFSEPEAPPKDTAPPESRSLTEVHGIFRKHFGETFDLDALDVTLAVAASQELDGDPVWLLLVGGPGVAKTEMVQTLVGADAHVTSTIASEGALLSAAPSRGKAKKTATGGLLRKIGDEGILVIKDVTSILSASHDARASVLAALREVYDGRWERNVGIEGGQTLTWTGRITLIGAVTTAWDTHHAVVSVMGDRFVLVRIDSREKNARLAAGLRAMNNTGSETEMRQALADAIGGLLKGEMDDKREIELTDSEKEVLLSATNIVTLARTAVELDFKRDVIDSHSPEMPTRFAKQLVQVVRGGRRVGMTAEHTMKLAIRCARDSIPPLRIAILCDVALHPDSMVADVHKRIGKPRSTVKREMDALTALKMLVCDEVDVITTQASFNEGGEDEVSAKKKWTYQLADDIDRKTLLAMAGREGEDNPFTAAASVHHA